MNVPQRLQLLADQGGVCAICKTPIEFTQTKGGGSSQFEAVIDHCHTTGKVRGVLCGLCNTGLGRFKDDKERLQRAITYLTESQVST